MSIRSDWLSSPQYFLLCWGCLSNSLLKSVVFHFVCFLRTRLHKRSLLPAPLDVPIHPGYFSSRTHTQPERQMSSLFGNICARLVFKCEKQCLQQQLVEVALRTRYPSTPNKYLSSFLQMRILWSAPRQLFFTWWLLCKTAPSQMFRISLSIFAVKYTIYVQLYSHIHSNFHVFTQSRTLLHVLVHLW